MARQFELLRRISIALAILGILVAGYLTWADLTKSEVVCIGSNGCGIVQNSSYSSVAGIPVALLGLVGYVAILGLLLLEYRGGQLADNTPLILFGLTLLGVAYSAYLTYLELFVILAICLYCVASAVIMAALFGIAVYRVLTPAQE